MATGSSEGTRAYLLLEWCKLIYSHLKILVFIAILSLVFFGYKAVAQYGGGGGGISNFSGGSSSSLQRDYCPEGDNTFSYYDGLCDEGDVIEEIVQSKILVGTTNTVITTEEENAIAELKREIEVVVPTLETITLPDFLPETGSM